MVLLVFGTAILLAAGPPPALKIRFSIISSATGVLRAK